MGINQGFARRKRGANIGGLKAGRLRERLKRGFSVEPQRHVTFELNRPGQPRARRHHDNALAQGARLRCYLVNGLLQHSGIVRAAIATPA